MVLSFPEIDFVLETSCHRKIFQSQEIISCHRKKVPVTRRNFLSQEKISYCRKKFPVTGRNFLSIYPTLCWILICIGNIATFIIIYTYDQELLYFGSNTSSPGKSCQEGKTILPSCVYLRPIYYMSNAYLR